MLLYYHEWYLWAAVLLTIGESLMRKLFVAACMGVLLASAGIVEATTCGCSGAACSTSSTCADGCWAVCGSGGCASGCAENQIATAAVNLSLKGVAAEDVAALISQQIGARFAFIPSDPRDPITVELKDVYAPQLVKVFGAFGGAGLARPVEGKHGKAVVLTLRAKNITTGELARMLADLAGDELSFTPANPEERVALEVKDVSARDLKKALTAYGKIEAPSRSK